MVIFRKNTVCDLRALAEIAYGGRRPGISLKRAVLLSQAADEIEELRVQLYLAQSPAPSFQMPSAVPDANPVDVEPT